MNRAGHKNIYKESVIRTAKQYNFLKYLSPIEVKKLNEFPEEDVAIIRYLTYFIANNYIGFSEKSRKYKKFGTSIENIIYQSSFINLEIKPFHVLVAYVSAAATNRIIKTLGIKSLLNISIKEKIIHIPFDELFFKETKYFSKKQQIKFQKIGLKRHVDFKNTIRSAGEA